MSKGEKAKLLHHKTILRLCLFIVMLTFISSCGCYYYKNSQGWRVNTPASVEYYQEVCYINDGDYARAISEFTKP